MIHKLRQLRHRNGLTLVELLIVIFIITILTAITLPSFKTVMKDRKTNQAAMLVRAALENARVTAMATGRNVAVVLERANSNYVFAPGGGRVGDAFAMNAATKLSIAEVLPPYKGDTNLSTISLSAPVAPATVPNVGVLDLVANPSAKFFLQVGNSISFGEWPNRFLITDVVFSASPDIATVTFSNVELALFNSVPTVEPYAAAVSLPTGAVTFKIYAKPRRLFTKSIDMPRGTCVDLSLSGMGHQTFDVSPAAFFTGTRPNSLDATRKSTVAHSPSLMFASDEIDLDQADLMNENEFRPVYIVFNSRGELAHVWQNTFDAAGMIGFLPSSNIYLMVGRTELVPIEDANLSLAYRFNPPDSASRGSNLYDGSSYWVRVSTGSGQVAVGANGDPRTADPVPSDSRFPTYSSILSHCRKSVALGNELSGR